MTRVDPGVRRLGIPTAARVLASLKWHMLRGSLRGNLQQKLQVLASVGFSLVAGFAAVLSLGSIGRVERSADAMLVVFLPTVVAALGLLAGATGVEATIDARNLAGEPLTRWELGIGLLAAAAVGPAALLAVLTGFGIVAGWPAEGALAWVILLGAVMAWWVTLLTFSRTVGNLLGAVATTRFRQIAQAAATLAALAAWLVAQFATQLTDDWGPQRWQSLEDIARWTPPGQLGLAIVEPQQTGPALLHLLLGVSWLPLLVWASAWSTERLAHSPPRAGAGTTRTVGSEAGLRAGVLRFMPRGPVGAVATRSLRTKIRTPRQSVNTVTSLVVGAGALLIAPVIGGGGIDPRAVLVGGLLHFAVLFDGNNAYGMDGSAIWLEVQSGADGAVLTRGKIVASLVVMALPALLLPVALAVVSGGWVWLPAGWLIAVGSVLTATGVSIASATLAPVALPDSPNPLAAGDTGQGCIAAMMLGLCTVALGLASLPAGLLIVLASSRSPWLTAAAALLAPVTGLLVLRACSALARWRLRGREAELVQSVTLSR